MFVGLSSLNHFVFLTIIFYIIAGHGKKNVKSLIGFLNGHLNKTRLEICVSFLMWTSLDETHRTEK